MALTKAQQNVVERIDRQISSLEKRGWTYTQVDLADLRELINMAAILNVTEPMKLSDEELSMLCYWIKNPDKRQSITEFTNQTGVQSLIGMIGKLAGVQICAYNKAQDDAEALLAKQKAAAAEELESLRLLNNAKEDVERLLAKVKAAADKRKELEAKKQETAKTFGSNFEITKTFGFDFMDELVKKVADDSIRNTFEFFGAQDFHQRHEMPNAFPIPTGTKTSHSNSTGDNLKKSNGCK